MAYHIPHGSSSSAPKGQSGQKPLPTADGKAEVIDTAGMSTTPAYTLNAADVRELVESIITSLDALLDVENIMKALLLVLNDRVRFEASGGIVNPNWPAAEQMRSYLNMSPSDSCEIYINIYIYAFK